MIEFLCPEGHKIRCPKEQAGRPAKCPRCGVRFRIPSLEELGGAGSTTESPVAPAEVTDVPTPPPNSSTSGRQSAVAAAQSAPSAQGSAPAAPPAKKRQIEFLCPNGHHLHGPASLQGRAGECPECGSRFRIPLIDEPDPNADGTPHEEEISLDGAIPGMPEIESSGEPLDLFQVLEDAGSIKGHLSSVSSLTEPFARTPSTEPSTSTGNVHPLSAIFAELWTARSEESRVEVHLENGGVFLPDGYLKTHSQQGYAVLVTQDPDGCSTLTIVPWDGISRIIMRSMKEVPGEIVR